MRVILSVLLVLAFTSCSASAAAIRYFDDAALRAVHFADDKEGWVVGDEGVIWHTLDGGKTWERQVTGTRASLRSVFFLPKNPFVGWVAGREELPRGQGSVGVLLFTSNGGGTWQRLLVNVMPGLNQVRFTDDKTGYLFGDSSAQFPTGIFKTKDGGRSWEPIPPPPTPAGKKPAEMPSWLAGDFLTGQTGILAGAWGSLAVFRLDRFAAADIEDLGGRSLHGVFVFDHRALAVGDGGLVLTSESQGAKWAFAKWKFNDDSMANLDFHAVHGAGKHAWIVGRPGSVLLHSADQGKTWDMRKTGQALPLHGVFFIDEQRGWAVGELGLIMGSADGGQTWQAQHRGGKRAAILALHARPDEVPLETLARLGAEEGYLTTTLRVAAPDPASAPRSRATDNLRLAAATRQAGGAAAEMLWQFPLPQHLSGIEQRNLLAFWNQLHDNQADKQLLRQLVLALRTWRPAVVLTDNPDAKITDNTAGALIAEAVHKAVALAADDKAFPEQLKDLGLAPWRASRVYTQWDKRAGSHATVDGVEERLRLQGSAIAYAAGAAAMLNESMQTSPRQRYYRRADITEEGNGKGGHLMAGVAATAGDNRRVLPPAPPVELLKPYRDRRNLEAIAASFGDPAKTLAQIGPLLAGLPDDQGAAAALAIGSMYFRQGQWSLARETFLLMVDRYPAHPLSADAYRWLIRHISSSEARRRHELEQFHVIHKAGFIHQPVKSEDGKKTPPISEQVQMVQQARLTYLSDKMEVRQWYRGSLEFGKRLAGFGPLFASDPGVQFCLQASRRNLGEFEEARKWYQKFQLHFPRGLWHDAAAAELWLQRRQGPPPRPVVQCLPAADRPHLDGKLDDPCWKGRPLVLGNAAGGTGKEYPTEVRFAYDRQYLYIALRCKHPTGQRVPPVKRRKHDDDLRRHDRVSILLDLDRDYSTYFHLQIDQRGCLLEDCWGDLSWNPRWFVAVDSSDDCWQIEAAIPLAELTDDRLRAGTAWAVNVVRILPGRGVQAMSLPADVEPRPEGMGMLLFE